MIGKWNTKDSQNEVRDGEVDKVVSNIPCRFLPIELHHEDGDVAQQREEGNGGVEGDQEDVPVLGEKGAQWGEFGTGGGRGIVDNRNGSSCADNRGGHQGKFSESGVHGDGGDGGDKNGDDVDNG